jgi:hypothetical protein
MTMPTGIARCESGTPECAGCAAVAAGMAHRRSKRGERCAASQRLRRSWCVRVSLLAPEGYGGPRRKAGSVRLGEDANGSRGRNFDLDRERFREIEAPVG